VSGGRKNVVFCVLASRLWNSVLRLAVWGNTISGRFCSASEGAGVCDASICVERMSMGHTVG
jgi:hypothetical protein